MGLCKPSQGHTRSQGRSDAFVGLCRLSHGIRPSRQIATTIRELHSASSRILKEHLAECSGTEEAQKPMLAPSYDIARVCTASSTRAKRKRRRAARSSLRRGAALASTRPTPSGRLAKPLRPNRTNTGVDITNTQGENGLSELTTTFQQMSLAAQQHAIAPQIVDPFGPEMLATLERLQNYPQDSAEAPQRSRTQKQTTTIY